MNQQPAVPVRIRRVSAELRELRKQSGLALEEVARPLGFSVSHLSRVENGIRMLQPDDVAALLGFYRVSTAKRADLLALVREGDKYNWLLEHEGNFAVLEAFMRFEREAVDVKNYESSVIPGLLQVPEYTRSYCLGVDPNTPESHVEKIINYRMRRQQDCRKPGGPPLHVIFDEAACRRLVGGPEVMGLQLRYLAHAAKSPNLTVQVIPPGVGSHPGLEGSFMLLDLGQTGELLYTEDRCSVAFLEQAHHILAARKSFRRLCELACSPEDSLGLIMSIADEFSTDDGERGHGTPPLAQEQSQHHEDQLRGGGVR